MTNTSSRNNKESLLRLLAIAGLIGIIIIIAWLSVRIVQVTPSAFSSLASMVEGLQQYGEATVDNIEEEVEDAFTISPTIDEVTFGKEATLALGTNAPEGTFTFNYECTENITVIAVSETGGRELTCNTTYNLDDANLDLRFESITNGTTSLPYTVAFFETGATEALTTADGTITIAPNTSNEPVGEVAGESTAEPVEEVATEPPAVTQPETEIIYQIPISNPNGFVDLAATYIGVGTQSDVLQPTLEQDDEGVFYFSVRNVGTKTSGDWNFTASLPGGQTFISDKQAPLKPNERATLALTVTTDDDSSHTFRVVVETDEDRNETNNQFSQRVTLTR